MSFHVPEDYRQTTGQLASTKEFGNNGCFVIPVIPDHPLAEDAFFVCIVSDGMEWEHVSVRVTFGKSGSRMPTWPEMCFIKSVFWGDEDHVMQLHPKKSEYKNVHHDVLHLWRPTKKILPRPPRILV